MLRWMPPIGMRSLWLSLVFLTGWSGLDALGVAPEQAFVWSAVAAQLAHFGLNLPANHRRLSDITTNARRSILQVGALGLGAVALQLWWNDPWFTQRCLTAVALVLLGAVLLNYGGDAEDRAAYVRATGLASATDAGIRQYWRLRALTLMLVIAVNEALLASATPLGARVAVLALLPMALHVLFFVGVWLTWPIDEEGEAGD